MALTKITRAILDTGVSDSSDATAITIDSSENVGIGETSPDLKLHVKSSGQIAKLETTASTGDCILTFADASANKGFVGFGSSSSEIFQVTNIENGDMKFDTNNTERMRIDSSGNVGIGITSPTTALEVVGDIKIKEGSAYSNYGLIDVSEAVLTLETYSVNTSSYPANIIFKPAGTERVRIDSSGQVGIGETSPNAKLHIATADSTTFSASNSSWHTQVIKNDTGAASNASGLAFYTSANGYHVNAGTGIACVKNGTNSDYGAELVFITRPQAAVAEERMRIDSTGALLVGITSQIVSTTEECVHIKNGDGAGQLFLDNTRSSGNQFMVQIYRLGTRVGSIQTSTTGTSYLETSDYRLKENVDYDFNALERVAQLKPARFNFIKEPDETVDGFLAHEVSPVVPQAVSGEKDAVDEEGNPDLQGIDHSKLVPLLTKAIQELTAKVEELEKKV